MSKLDTKEYAVSIPVKVHIVPRLIDAKNTEQFIRELVLESYKTKLQQMTVKEILKG